MRKGPSYLELSQACIEAQVEPELSHAAADWWLKGGLRNGPLSHDMSQHVKTCQSIASTTFVQPSAGL